MSGLGEGSVPSVVSKEDNAHNFPFLSLLCHLSCFIASYDQGALLALDVPPPPGQRQLAFFQKVAILSMLLKSKYLVV